VVKKKTNRMVLPGKGGSERKKPEPIPSENLRGGSLVRKKGFMTEIKMTKTPGLKKQEGEGELN